MPYKQSDYYTDKDMGVKIYVIACVAWMIGFGFGYMPQYQQDPPVCERPHVEGLRPSK